MVIEMSMESVFAVVDIFFVAKLGSAAIAAVGLTEGLMTTVYAIAIGLSMGTTATVARRIGERKPQDAALVATQSIVIGVLLAAILGTVGLAFAPDLLRFMKASDAVVETGSGFTRIMTGTNIVIFLLFLNNAIFRGAGDAKIAMHSLILANSINIVLDPCLIFGVGPFPELGLEGAAVATTIGRGCGVLYQLRALRKGRGRLALRGDALRIDWPVLTKLVRVSFGGITQFLIATASWTVLIRLVADFGDEPAAGYTIAVRIVMFTFLPSWGLSNAAATLVGQSLGADDIPRAKRAVWLTGAYNAAFLGIVSVVFVTFPRPLVEFFVSALESEALAAGFDAAARERVIAFGATCLRTMSYCYVFFAWGMVMVQAFNGAGDTRTPNFINFACYWCFQIPLAYWFAKGLGHGPIGVFWAIAVSETIYALVSVLVFVRGRWTGKVV
ncbi:MAG: MATE family efflux transporter [Planctomycetes bacterium]|nr:MATE family efflux transporter [Planctomycetota bacterium]